MNLIPANLDKYRIQVSNHVILIKQEIHFTNNNIILGIRPRDIRIVSDRGIKVKLLGEEKLGSGYIIHVMLGDNEIAIYLEKEYFVFYHDHILINFDGPLYLFDQNTEELIGIVKDFEIVD